MKNNHTVIYKIWNIYTFNCMYIRLFLIKITKQYDFEVNSFQQGQTFDIFQLQD